MTQKDQINRVYDTHGGMQQQTQQAAPSLQQSGQQATQQQTENRRQSNYQPEQLISNPAYQMINQNLIQNPPNIAAFQSQTGLNSVCFSQ